MMSIQTGIDHIFLDYGNVCATLHAADFIRGFFERTGVRESELKAQLYGDVHGYSQLFADYECDKVSTAQFFHQLTTNLNCGGKICFDDFAQLFVDVFTPNLELEILLAQVPSTKKIYLLSNTNRLVHARVMATTPLVTRHIPCRHDRIMSYDIGVIKPHPDIYHAAFARAKAKPETCFFVDDLEQNISAWRALGGHGIVYNVQHHPIAYLEQAFEKHGLLS